MRTATVTTMVPTVLLSISKDDFRYLFDGYDCTHVFDSRQKTRQDKPTDKTRQDKTREDKTREDKRRQDKRREDKTRQQKRKEKKREREVSAGQQLPSS